MEYYGTLGPACADRDILIRMFEAGMTGIRLNMSHTGLRQAADMLAEYHAAAEAAGRGEAGLLIDLQGPEIRTGAVEAPTDLRTGEKAVFMAVSGEAAGNASPSACPVIPVSAEVLGLLEAGDRILLDDGRIEAAIEDKTAIGDKTAGGKGRLTARILRGGGLRSRVSLKIEGRYVDTPVLTAMDLDNLREAPSMGVTAVMQPFVRSGEDLRVLRRAMADCGAGSLRVWAKIENMEGVRQIRDILPEADMIVIARGDLGNDMPLWELPAVQKELSRICREAGKPFLVVTQMLTSMLTSAVPTRAEVSDIYNAALDGAEAVMLTNETAAGAYPAEAMMYLRKTCEEALRRRDG